MTNHFRLVSAPMSATDPIALVLLQEPRRAKTRLAPVLATDERAALVSAMLTDVVGALGGAGLTRVVVLAAGDEAAATARALGVDVLLDPPGRRGIDAAVEAAGRKLRATASLVLPADLALLTPAAVTHLVGEPGDVVVAPTSDAGTGGLLRRPGWVVSTRFGVRSAARHLLAARQAGLSAERVDIEGFSLDVDDPDDLATVLALEDGPGRVTTHVLAEISDLHQRLAEHSASSA